MAKKKEVKIQVKSVRGSFRDVRVREGGRKGGVTVLNPTPKGLPTIYVTDVSEDDTFTIKRAAGDRVQAKTGLSKAAIKKLGL